MAARSLACPSETLISVDGGSSHTTCSSWLAAGWEVWPPEAAAQQGQRPPCLFTSAHAAYS